MAGLDPRRVRVHRNYTIAEAAHALGVNPNTVRRWIRDGLHAFIERRPYLILGTDLKQHLEAKRVPKARCALDEFYCFSCREPRRTKFGIVAFRRTTPTSGMLNGHCETCGSTVFRAFKTARLPDLVRAGVEVTSERGHPDLSRSPSPLPDAHFEKVPHDA